MNYKKNILSLVIVGLVVLAFAHQAVLAENVQVQVDVSISNLTDESNTVLPQSASETVQATLDQPSAPTVTPPVPAAPTQGVAPAPSVNPLHRDTPVPLANNQPHLASPEVQAIAQALLLPATGLSLFLISILSFLIGISSVFIFPKKLKEEEIKNS
jgi:hypothetical protein